MTPLVLLDVDGVLNALGDDDALDGRVVRLAAGVGDGGRHSLADHLVPHRPRPPAVLARGAVASSCSG